MPSPFPRSHPCKAKGEWAESAFLSRALALGLVVSKPWGDSARYDFIVEGKNGVRRVQVKSTWYRDRKYRCYRVTAGRGKRVPRCYSAREVDLIAAYIGTRDVWYFIPVSALRGRKRLAVFPDNPESTGQFERYREAWHLLV